MIRHRTARYRDRCDSNVRLYRCAMRAESNQEPRSQYTDSFVLLPFPPFPGVADFRLGHVADKGRNRSVPISTEFLRPASWAGIPAFRAIGGEPAPASRRDPIPVIQPHPTTLLVSLGGAMIYVPCAGDPRHELDVQLVRDIAEFLNVIWTTHRTNLRSNAALNMLFRSLLRRISSKGDSLAIDLETRIADGR
ncbi:MAG: hypothetical protein JWM11_3337 [Planctomycetaceae bacterium]|nr:hypothetical protein [Planctomycetaceae bacterium]